MTPRSHADHDCDAYAEELGREQDSEDMTDEEYEALVRQSEEDRAEEMAADRAMGY